MINTLQFQANELERIAREYAHYQAAFADRQRAQNAFDDEFGLPRTDLAWVKVQERASLRAATKTDWETHKRQFILEMQRKRFAQAIGHDE